MKKLLSIVVASVLLLTTSAVPTLAKGNIKPNQLSQNTLAEKHLDAPSEYFKTFCNDFFKDCSTYEALDLQGHNITKQFYNDNLNASKNKDFNSIWKYAKENISMFTNTVISDAVPNLENKLRMGIDTTRNVARPYSLSKTKNVKKLFYQLNTKTKYAPNFEFAYWVSGSFVYNPNTGKISSYSGPYINMHMCSLHGVWSYTMYNISTSGKISSDKYSVTFSGSFSLHTWCNLPIGNISQPAADEYFGPYYGSFSSSGDAE